MEKVIVIIGPTAVGKTKLSIEVAKQLNGEIINGDSTQVYRDLSIGTAKITEEEMEGIPHHLINIKNPEEPFTVAEFQRLVREKITEITNRGKLPIIAGGTGLYVQAALYDYDFSQTDEDEALRNELEQFAEEKGALALHEKLQAIDSESGAKIHPNNVRRVIRAIEVFQVTGIPMSKQQKSERIPLYDIIFIGLTMDREFLYNRINQRAEKMMEAGLLEEVATLYNRGLADCQSMRAIGYKELVDFLQEKCTLEEAIASIQQNTRNYAKRQLTWFRNKMNITWFDVTKKDQTKEILKYLTTHLV